jgi:HTH-type transcriptional regulator, sugar sensing transcriptional regulator
MEEFMKLGLTKYESSLYEAILKLKRASAQELSDISKVPITATYPNLETLSKKGLIQVYNGIIREYQLNPPQQAIRNYINNKINENKSIWDDAISKALIISEKDTLQSYDSPIFLSKGKELSKEIYKIYIDKVKKTYYILGWRLEKIGDKYEFLRELSKIVKKGIDVRIILTGSKKKVNSLIQDYKIIGIKIKYLPLDNFSLLIVDSKICKITLKDRNLPDKYNITIKDNNLSYAMNSYFLAQWEKSNPI